MKQVWDLFLGPLCAVAISPGPRPAPRRVPPLRLTSRVGDMVPLARKHEWLMAHVALAWINKRVTSPIIGCSSLKRLDEAIGSNGKCLDSDEEQYLEKL